VLTYNIWNYSGGWRERRHLLVQLLRDADADVIALQEVRHNWRDLPGWNQGRWLARQTGYVLTYRPAAVLWPVPPVVEGLAFLTRTAGRVRAYTVPRLPWSGPRRCILETQVQGVRLFNVHFPLTERARIAEARSLAQLIAVGSGPAVVLGDLNADSDQEPLILLRDSGLQDAWEAASSGASGPAWPCQRRIDYILTRGMRPTGGGCTVIGAQPGPSGCYPSDHVGLIADLEVVG